MRNPLWLILIQLIPITVSGQADLRKENGFTHMTRVQQYIHEGQLKSDTTENFELYDSYGRVIEQKYTIGTPILHKYVYSQEGKLLHEYLLTPNTGETFHQKKMVYPDTFGFKHYHYNDRGNIQWIIMMDNWGMFSGTAIFKYNSSQMLVSRIEFDSDSNIHDFEIHKYNRRDNTILEYSIVNHEQMTTESFYYYDKVHRTLLKSRTQFREGQTTYYYDETGQRILKSETETDGELSARADYNYEKGILLEMTEFIIDEQGQEVFDRKWIYLYE